MLTVSGELTANRVHHTFAWDRREGPSGRCSEGGPKGATGVDRGQMSLVCLGAEQVFEGVDALHRTFGGRLEEYVGGLRKYGRENKRAGGAIA